MAPFLLRLVILFGGLILCSYFTKSFTKTLGAFRIGRLFLKIWSIIMVSSRVLIQWYFICLRCLPLHLHQCPDSLTHLSHFSGYSTPELIRLFLLLGRLWSSSFLCFLRAANYLLSVPPYILLGQIIRIIVFLHPLSRRSMLLRVVPKQGRTTPVGPFASQLITIIPGRSRTWPNVILNIVIKSMEMQRSLLACLIPFYILFVFIIFIN